MTLNMDNYWYDFTLISIDFVASGAFDRVRTSACVFSRFDNNLITTALRV